MNLIFLFFFMFIVYSNNAYKNIYVVLYFKKKRKLLN